MHKTIAISLTIPDNEAFTALATLRRIGVAVGGVRRADIWTFDVADDAARMLGPTIAQIETIFNPNKHRLAERADSQPLPGEVWIAAREDEPRIHLAGRTLAGVRGIQRCVAWQLLDETGRLVSDDVLARAIETFLCNPAFQKAIR